MYLLVWGSYQSKGQGLNYTVKLNHTESTTLGFAAAAQLGLEYTGESEYTEYYGLQGG